MTSSQIEKSIENFASKFNRINADVGVKKSLKGYFSGVDLNKFPNKASEIEYLLYNNLADEDELHYIVKTILETHPKKTWESDIKPLNKMLEQLNLKIDEKTYEVKILETDSPKIVSDISPVEAIEGLAKKDVFVAKTVRIFISYSTVDEKVASAVQEAFNHHGMDAFLADEDSHAGKLWKENIIKHIQQCDVFVAVLTENFKKSLWTDQEVGYAICNQKNIVPVSVDSTIPYGFLGEYNSLKKFEIREYSDYRSGETILDCRSSVFKIIEIIAEDTKLRENLKDSLIRSLSNMNSYAKSEKCLSLLDSIKPFNEGQINELIKESISNNQIHDAHECQAILKELIKEYESIIEPESIESISKLIYS